MASKVEKELQELTGVKPKAKEGRQAYLQRLIGAVGELDDKDWKGMSTPAQKWSNAASNAFDADKDIPDFEGAAEDEAPKGKAKAQAKEDEDPGEGAEDGETNADADDAEGEAADGESEDTDMADKKTSKKAKAPAKASKAAKPEKAAPKAKAAAKPKAEKKAKGSGAVQAVMAHVLKSPDDSVPDVIAALKKQGITVTPATASSARGFFKLVVRFLQDKKLTTKKLFD